MSSFRLGAAPITMVLMILFGPNCANPNRPDPRTTVAADSEYAFATNETTGCGGEVQIQRHRQVGGRVSIDHQAAGGFHVAGSVGASAGHVTETRNIEDAVIEDYWLGQVAAEAGFAWPSIGFDVGYGAHYGAGHFFFVPRFRLKAGDLSTLWWELTGGEFDGPYRAHVAMMGVGYDLGTFRGRTAFGLVTRPIVNATDGEHVYAMDDTRLAPGLSIEVAWVPDPFELRVAGTLSRDAGARLGIGYSW